MAKTLQHRRSQLRERAKQLTLAGSAGLNGTADGTASNARFFSPYAIETDSTGNLFVAESINRTIRKITAAGSVTTLAGVPEVPGTKNGAGSECLFDTPQGVAVDSAGNVYVADTNNHTIRIGAPAQP